MTPTTLAQLFDTPKSKITFDGDIYALHKPLNLKPWHPAAVQVWVEREPPEYLRKQQRWDWMYVRNLLDELYVEHERRKKNANR